jgi:hypothetical protein
VFCTPRMICARLNQVIAWKGIQVIAWKGIQYLGVAGLTLTICRPLWGNCKLAEYGGKMPRRGLFFKVESGSCYISGI